MSNTNNNTQVPNTMTNASIYPNKFGSSLENYPCVSDTTHTTNNDNINIAEHMLAVVSGKLSSEKSTQANLWLADVTSGKKTLMRNMLMNQAPELQGVQLTVCDDNTSKTLYEIVVGLYRELSFKLTPHNLASGSCNSLTLRQPRVKKITVLRSEDVAEADTSEPVIGWPGDCWRVLLPQKTEAPSLITPSQLWELLADTVAWFRKGKTFNMWIKYEKHGKNYHILSCQDAPFRIPIFDIPEGYEPLTVIETWCKPQAQAESIPVEVSAYELDSGIELDYDISDLWEAEYLTRCSETLKGNDPDMEEGLVGARDYIENVLQGLGINPASVKRNANIEALINSTNERLLEPALRPTGKRQLEVSTSLDSTVCEQLRTDWPETELVMVRKATNPHTYLAASRTAITRWLVSIMPKHTALFDIGGDFALHVDDGDLHVHSCYKHASPQDQARYINLTGRAKTLLLKKLAKNSAADQEQADRASIPNVLNNLSPENLSWCDKAAEDCLLQPVDQYSYGMSVDTLYYIKPIDLLKIYAHKRIVKCTHAITLPKDYKYKNEGALPFNEGTWHKVNGKLIMTMTGLSQSYINDLETIDFYLNNPVIVADNFMVYCKVEGRRGPYMIVEHYVMARHFLHSDSMLHTVWQTTDDNVVMLFPVIDIHKPVSLLMREPFVMQPTVFNRFFLEKLLNRLMMPYTWDQLTAYASGLIGRHYVSASGVTQTWDQTTFTNDIVIKHCTWAYWYKSDLTESIMPLIKKADNTTHKTLWWEQAWKAMKTFLMELGRQFDPTDNELVNEFISTYSEDTSHIRALWMQLGMAKSAYNTVLELGANVSLVDVIAVQYNIKTDQVPDVAGSLLVKDRSVKRNVMSLLTESANNTITLQCNKLSHCPHDHNEAHTHIYISHTNTIHNCNCCGINSTLFNGWCTLCLQHYPCTGKNQTCLHEHKLKNDECCGLSHCKCKKDVRCICCGHLSLSTLCRVCIDENEDEKNSSETSESSDDDIETSSSSNDSVFAGKEKMPKKGTENKKKSKKNESKEKKKEGGPAKEGDTDAKDNTMTGVKSPEVKPDVTEVEAPGQDKGTDVEKEMDQPADDTDIEEYDYMPVNGKFNFKGVVTKAYCEQNVAIPTYAYNHLHKCLWCHKVYQHEHFYTQTKHYQAVYDCPNCYAETNIPATLIEDSFAPDDAEFISRTSVATPLFANTLLGKEEKYTIWPTAHSLKASAPSVWRECLEYQAYITFQEHGSLTIPDPALGMIEMLGEKRERQARLNWADDLSESSGDSKGNKGEVRVEAPQAKQPEETNTQELDAPRDIDNEESTKVDKGKGVDTSPSDKTFSSLHIQHMPLIDRNKPSYEPMQVPQQEFFHTLDFSAIVINYGEADGDGFCGAHSLAQLWKMDSGLICQNLKYMTDRPDWWTADELGAYAIVMGKNLAVTSGFCSRLYCGNSKSWEYDCITSLSEITGDSHWVPANLRYAYLANWKLQSLVEFNSKIAAVASAIERGEDPEEVARYDDRKLLTAQWTLGGANCAFHFNQSQVYETWKTFPGKFIDGRIVHTSKSFKGKKLTDYTLKRPSGLRLCYAPTGMGKTTRIWEVVQSKKILLITPSVATVKGAVSHMTNIMKKTKGSKAMTVVGRAQEKWWPAGKTAQDAANANVLVMTVNAAYARYCQDKVQASVLNLIKDRFVVLDELHMMTPNYYALCRVLGNHVKLVMTATPHGVTASSDTAYPVTTIISDQPLATYLDDSPPVDGTFIVCKSEREADDDTLSLRNEVRDENKPLYQTIVSKTLPHINLDTVHGGGVTECVTTGATLPLARVWVDKGVRWDMYYTCQPANEGMPYIFSKDRDDNTVTQINKNTTLAYTAKRCIRMQLQDADQINVGVSEIIQSRGRVGRTAEGTAYMPYVSSGRIGNPGEIIDYCLKGGLPIPECLREQFEKLKNFKKINIDNVKRACEIAIKLGYPDETHQMVSDAQSWNDWRVELEPLLKNAVFTADEYGMDFVMSKVYECLEQPSLLIAADKQMVKKASQINQGPSTGEASGLSRLAVSKSHIKSTVVSFVQPTFVCYCGKAADLVVACSQCVFMLPRTTTNIAPTLKQWNFTEPLRAKESMIVAMGQSASKQHNKDISQALMNTFASSYNAIYYRVRRNITDGVSKFADSVYTSEFTNTKAPEFPSLKKLNDGEIGIVYVPRTKHAHIVLYKSGSWVGMPNVLSGQLSVHMHNNNHILGMACMVDNMEPIDPSRCRSVIANSQIWIGGAGTGKTTQMLKETASESLPVVSKQSLMLNTVLKQRGETPISYLIRANKPKSVCIDEIGMFDTIELIVMAQFVDKMYLAGDLNQKTPHGEYLSTKADIAMADLLKEIPESSKHDLLTVYRYGEPTGKVIKRFMNPKTTFKGLDDGGIEFHQMFDTTAKAIQDKIVNHKMELAVTHTNSYANAIIEQAAHTALEVTTTGRAQGYEADNVAYFACCTALKAYDASELYVAMTRHKKKLNVFYDNRGYMALSRLLEKSFIPSRNGNNNRDDYTLVEKLLMVLNEIVLVGKQTFQRMFAALTEKAKRFIKRILVVLSRAKPTGSERNAHPGFDLYHWLLFASNKLEAACAKACEWVDEYYKSASESIKAKYKKLIAGDSLVVAADGQSVDSEAENIVDVGLVGSMARMHHVASCIDPIASSAESVRRRTMTVITTRWLKNTDNISRRMYNRLTTNNQMSDDVQGCVNALVAIAYNEGITELDQFDYVHTNIASTSHRATATIYTVHVSEDFHDANWAIETLTSDFEWTIVEHGTKNSFVRRHGANTTGRQLNEPPRSTLIWEHDLVDVSLDNDSPEGNQEMINMPRDRLLILKETLHCMLDWVKHHMPKLWDDEKKQYTFGTPENRRLFARLKLEEGLYCSEDEDSLEELLQDEPWVPYLKHNVKEGMMLFKETMLNVLRGVPHLWKLIRPWLYKQINKMRNHVASVSLNKLKIKNKLQAVISKTGQFLIESFEAMLDGYTTVGYVFADNILGQVWLNSMARDEPVILAGWVMTIVLNPVLRDRCGLTNLSQAMREISNLNTNVPRLTIPVIAEEVQDAWEFALAYLELNGVFVDSTTYDGKSILFALPAPDSFEFCRPAVFNPNNYEVKSGFGTVASREFAVSPIGNQYQIRGINMHIRRMGCINDPIDMFTKIMETWEGNKTAFVEQTRAVCPGYDNDYQPDTSPFRKLFCELGTVVIETVHTLGKVMINISSATLLKLSHAVASGLQYLARRIEEWNNLPDDALENSIETLFGAAKIKIAAFSDRIPKEFTHSTNTTGTRAGANDDDDCTEFITKRVESMGNAAMVKVNEILDNFTCCTSEANYNDWLKRTFPDTYDQEIEFALKQRGSFNYTMKRVIAVVKERLTKAGIEVCDNLLKPTQLLCTYLQQNYPNMYKNIEFSQICVVTKSAFNKLYEQLVDLELVPTTLLQKIGIYAIGMASITVDVCETALTVMKITKRKVEQKAVDCFESIQTYLEERVTQANVDDSRAFINEWYNKLDAESKKIATYEDYVREFIDSKFSKPFKAIQEQFAEAAKRDLDEEIEKLNETSRKLLPPMIHDNASEYYSAISDAGNVEGVGLIDKTNPLMSPVSGYDDVINKMLDDHGLEPAGHINANPATDKLHENSHLVAYVTKVMEEMIEWEDIDQVKPTRKSREMIQHLLNRVFPTSGSTINNSITHDSIRQSKSGWFASIDNSKPNVTSFKFPLVPEARMMFLTKTHAVLTIDKVAVYIVSKGKQCTMYWSDTNLMRNDKLISKAHGMLAKFAGSNDVIVKTMQYVLREAEKFLRVMRDEVVWRVKAATGLIHFEEHEVDMSVRTLYLAMLSDLKMIGWSKLNKGKITRYRNHIFFDRRSKNRILDCHTHIHVEKISREKSRVKIYSGKAETFNLMLMASPWLQMVTATRDMPLDEHSLDFTNIAGHLRTHSTPVSENIEQFRQQFQFENQRAGDRIMDNFAKFGIHKDVNSILDLINSQTVADVYAALHSSPLFAQLNVTMENNFMQTKTDALKEEILSEMMANEGYSHVEKAGKVLIILMASGTGKTTLKNNWQSLGLNEICEVYDVDDGLTGLEDIAQLPWHSKAFLPSYRSYVGKVIENAKLDRKSVVLLCHYPEQVPDFDKYASLVVHRTDVDNLAIRPWSMENHAMLNMVDGPRCTHVTVDSFSKQNICIINGIKSSMSHFSVNVSTDIDMAPLQVQYGTEFYETGDRGPETVWMLPSEGKIMSSETMFVPAHKQVTLVGGPTEINRPTISGVASACFNALATRLHGIMPLRKVQIEPLEYVENIKSLFIKGCDEHMKRFQADPITPSAEMVMDWLVNKGHRLELLSDMVANSVNYDKATDYTRLSAHYKVENLMKEKVDELDDQIGRLIVWNNQNINMFICGVINEAKKRFKALLNKELITYADGLDMVMINNKLKKVKKSTYMLEMDLSKQDRQTDKPITEAEHDLLLQLGVSPEVVAYMRQICDGFQLQTSDKFKSRRPAMRLTGGAMTALGNVIRNLLIMADINEKYDVNHIFVLGDDSLILTDDEVSEDWLQMTCKQRHNVIATINVSEKTGVFLQLLIGYIPDLGYVASHNFSRLRERMSVMSYEYGSEESIAKFASYLMMIGKCAATDRAMSHLGATIYPPLGSTMSDRVTVNAMKMGADQGAVESLIEEIVNVIINPMLRHIDYYYMAKGTVRDMKIGVKTYNMTNTQYAAAAMMKPMVTKRKVNKLTLLQTVERMMLELE
ncbi:polyprotein [Morchella importuna endornavirus 3]|nr:polyprotein [Morchella importuna endornavirus 3]